MKHIQVVFDFYLSCFHAKFQDALTRNDLYFSFINTSCEAQRNRLGSDRNVSTTFRWTNFVDPLTFVHAKNFNYDNKYKSDAVSIAADS